MKKCVIIPTLNEEAGIGKVINSIPKGYDIYVVDGGSRDRTTEIAKSMGANILEYPRKGKGYCVKKFIEEFDYDIYVLIDGDGSYDGKFIPELVKPIVNGKADLVLGSRFLNGKVENICISRLIGNKIINGVFRTLNNSNISDCATGLRAMSRKFIKNVNLKSNGFNIDVEITLLACKNYKIIEIPIKYLKRLGSSKLKFFDMIKIFFFTIYTSILRIR